MQLVQVRQYLTQQLPAVKDGVKDNDSLTKGLVHRRMLALNMLRAKTLVTADAGRGLKVLDSGRLLGFTNTNANNIVAFRRRGICVTIADYYRERKEPLAFPTLPVLVIGEENKAHREYFPLEKVYLHQCGRPCNCLSHDNTLFRPVASVPPTRRDQQHPSPPVSEDESTVTIVHKPRAISPRIKEASSEHTKQQRMLERIARIIVDSGAVKLPSVPVTPPVQKPDDARRLLQCSFAESMLRASSGRKTVPQTRSADANFNKVRSGRSGWRKNLNTDPEAKVILQRFIDESDQEREDESSDEEPRAGCSHD